MPKYSDDLIEEIRSRNDIVDVIGETVKLKRSGANYFGLCPFHNEKTGSFSVSRDKQMYYCFGCGAGGNVISYVMDYENYSFPEAVKFLADRAGVELPEYEETAEEKRARSFKERVLECLKTAAVYYYKKLYSNEGKLGLDYLKKRGLTDETIKSFGLGFSGRGYDELIKYLKEKGFSVDIIEAAGLCNISEKYGMTDRFFNRVMFPIMDINSKVIGFGGRVMGDGKPKYLNSPETIVFDKSHNMYGLNVARRSRKPYKIVCEGYMDVISMHQAGFTEAVASLGTAFTSGHASLLRRYANDIRLTYDSDEAGMKAAMRAIPICNEAGLPTKVIHMDPYKDPDEFIKEMGSEKFQERINEAENSFFFELRFMERGLDLSDPEDRTAFLKKAAARLADIDDEISRETYISSVAAKYSVKEEILRRSVAVAYEKREEREASRLSIAGDGMMTGYSRNDVDNTGTFGEGKDRNTRSGSEKAERYLLTWISDDENVYEAVKPYITPEDFGSELTKNLARMIYDGYEKKNFNIAEIITRFAIEDQAREASSIINAHIEAVESESERSGALTDLVIKVKKAALDRKKNDDDGTDPLKKALEEKKALAELKHIKISI